MARPAAVDRLAAMLLERESRATEVARLLHDHAGQTLSAAGFYLHATGGAGEVVENLEHVIESIRTACNKLQTNCVERAGLRLSIELLAEKLRREERLDVRLSLNVKHRLPTAAGFAVYRIIELALENVEKHSGIRIADVSVNVEESGINAKIQDRGCGFNVRKTLTYPPGTGLVLMNSYAGSVNLHLRIASTRRRGTIIEIQTN